MPANPASWKTETEVMRRLDAELEDLADSPRLRRLLREWARDDSRLAFESGSDLVEAAQNRKASNWVDRDQVLAAVLGRFEDDPLARRVKDEADSATDSRTEMSPRSNRRRSLAVSRVGARRMQIRLSGPELAEFREEVGLGARPAFSLAVRRVLPAPRTGR